MSTCETFRQKSIYVIYNLESVKNESSLINWSKERGFLQIPLNTFSETELARQCNQLAEPSHLVVWVDYPIQSAFDLETLQAFVTHLLNHPGQWYYAPRPNDYVQVHKTALVGMNPVSVINVRNQFKYRLGDWGKRALSSSWLPSASRAALGRLAQRMWRKWKSGCSNTNTNGDGAIQDGKPQVAIPKNIRGWLQNWQAWKPSANTLRHDLIDRVEHFFPHPESIHVILLNKCNLKCIMCPYHSPRYTAHHTSGFFDKTELMPDHVFNKIADYAGRNGIPLQFGQIEEPLMHPQIFDFFKLAKQAGVPHIHITTNGTLLNQDRANRLARTGINSLMFSIDAARPETYKTIRGKDLHKLEESIKYFMPLAKRNHIQVMVSFILQPEAHHEREQFLEKWRQVGMDSVTFYVLTEHDPRTGAMIRAEEMYERGARYPCASPWLQAVVFPQGEISLCCKTMTDVGWRGIVSVGNLQTQSFEEIWLSERYRRARNELLENVFCEFEVCADCQIWSASSYVREEVATYVRTYNETMETISFVDISG